MSSNEIEQKIKDILQDIAELRNPSNSSSSQLQKLQLVEVALNEVSTALAATQQQQIEQTLQQFIARFQRLAENVPGMIYQYCLYPDGRDRFTYISPRVRSIFELEPQAVCENSQLIWASIHPDDVNAFRASVIHSARTLSQWCMEWRIITPSGVLKWLQGVSQPQQQPDATLIWDGFVLDISQRKMAEEALKESEEQFRQLAEHIPQVFWMTSADYHQLLYVSPAYEEIWQRSCSSLYEDPSSWFNAIHPDDKQRVEAAHRSISDGTCNQEYRIIRSDGSIRWIGSRTFPIRNEKDEVYRLAGISTDITQPKLVESELRQQKELLQTIFDHIPVMVAFYDAGGQIQFANRELERILGCSLAQPENCDLSTFCCPDPESYQSLEDFIQAATGKWQDFRTVAPDGSVLDTSWANIRLSDGMTISIGQDITNRRQVLEELRLSEARFRELAQREALLNRLARQIRRSLDLNTILQTAVDEIRQLLQVDRCWFLWYRPNEAEPVWEIVSEARIAAFPSLIAYRIPVTEFGSLTARLLNKETIRVDSARTLTTSAERKLFLRMGYTALLALPIHTTSGEIGVVSCGNFSGSRPWHDPEVELLQAVADQLAIAIDQAQLLHQSRLATANAQKQAAQLEQALYQLQQTQAQLVQSEKMSSLGQMVAGVAHEINNPINFIHGNLTHLHYYAQDLLKLVQLYQTYYPHPIAEIQASIEEMDLDFITLDLPKLLSSMKMGADRIAEIVMSLRNFSRLDEAEMKQVDIHEGIDNTLLILAHRLKSQRPNCPDIQVTKDYGNLPQVPCYPAQLNQVFMNILVNAIDAIDEYNKERSLEDINNNPSTIRISTQVNDNNQVIIRIVDNGAGVSEEVSRRIFEPFFTTKPIGQGTGLGLSISYQIVVEKHAGRLECISVPNQGTEFLITIPIASFPHSL